MAIPTQWYDLRGFIFTKRGKIGKAAKWFRKAALNNNVEAMNALGNIIEGADGIYEAPSGIAQNYSEAVKWYRKAAQLGSGMGAYNLGRMYERGKGVSANLPEAIKWYRVASQRKIEEADLSLSRLGAPR